MIGTIIKKLAKKPKNFEALQATPNYNMQRVKRKINIFTRLHKLGSASLLAQQSCPVIVIVFTVSWLAKLACYHNATRWRQNRDFSHIHELQSGAKIMRLFAFKALNFAHFDWSLLINFNFLLTISPLPPQTMLSRSFELGGMLSLLQHCFGGEGGSKYEVSRIFAQDCRLPAR